MYEWHKQVQKIVDDIDICIINRDDDSLTLRSIAKTNGWSEYHVSRKFQELSGITLRVYLRKRRLTFALIDIRDTEKSILEIAMDYGFSSHEAFCRSFKAMYGMPPSTYRANPRPVVLSTKIMAFDRYFLGLREIGMVKSSKEVKIYFVSMPAHKFLHVKNYGSNGYWEFWEALDKVPETNCDLIAGLLDSITGKLDGEDGLIGKYSGQIMGRINEGSVRAEAYGVRLPIDYKGEIPSPMTIMDVPALDYIVFEHGSFDYEQEAESVGKKLEDAINNFDYSDTLYEPDKAAGRISYFYFDAEKYEKWVLPVKRK